jgi:hypothetical protein
MEATELEVAYSKRQYIELSVMFIEVYYSCNGIMNCNAVNISHVILQQSQERVYGMGKRAYLWLM